jgi:hypothetical protein
MTAADQLAVLVEAATAAAVAEVRRLLGEQPPVERLDESTGQRGLTRDDLDELRRLIAGRR